MRTQAKKKTKHKHTHTVTKLFAGGLSPFLLLFTCLSFGRCVTEIHGSCYIHQPSGCGRQCWGTQRTAGSRIRLRQLRVDLWPWLSLECGVTSQETTAAFYDFFCHNIHTKTQQDALFISTVDVETEWRWWWNVSRKKIRSFRQMWVLLCVGLLIHYCIVLYI